MDGIAGAEGGAAAAGDVVVADRVGADDLRMHILGGDAQRLGQLHGDGGAAAADVGRAFDQADGAVGVDAGRDARLAAPVEPEAGGHAAPAVGAFQRRAVVRVILDGLQRLDIADQRQGRAVGTPVALLDRVDQAEVDRVDAQLLGQFVDHRLGRKGGVGAARRAVGRRLGLVDEHVVAVDLHVVELVRGQDHAGAGADRRAGEGAGLVDQLGLGCRDRAVLLGADLDA